MVPTDARIELYECPGLYVLYKRDVDRFHLQTIVDGEFKSVELQCLEQRVDLKQCQHFGGFERASFGNKMSALSIPNRDGDTGRHRFSGLLIRTERTIKNLLAKKAENAPKEDIENQSKKVNTKRTRGTKRRRSQIQCDDDDSDHLTSNQRMRARTKWTTKRQKKGQKKYDWLYFCEM